MIAEPSRAGELALDFSGLFSGEPPEKQAATSPVETFLGAGEYNSLSDSKKPVESRLEGLDGQRARDVYKTYQENVKASSQLQTAILKGVAAGEDVYSLFLKAVKAVSLMTSNELFYRQIEADIKAVYGRGLQHKPPLQQELRETEERLQRLQEAAERERGTDSGDRISRAVRAHRQAVDELKNMIAKTEERD